MKITGNEPAFPHKIAQPRNDGEAANFDRPGISIRLELAARAMQGLMFKLVEYKDKLPTASDGQFVVDQLVIDSFRVADAMIEHYNKGQADE